MCADDSVFRTSIVFKHKIELLEKQDKIFVDCEIVMLGGHYKAQRLNPMESIAQGLDPKESILIA